MWRDFVFLLRKCAGFIKTAFYVSMGTSLGESIFLKNFFFEISDIAQKSFRFFSQYFGRVCQNCVKRVRKNKLKQTSFTRKIIFSTSLDFGWQTCVYLLRKSPWSCQNHILRFYRNSVRKFNLSGKYVFCLSFWAFEQSFSALCRKLSRSFFEAAFHVSKEILSWQKFLEKKLFFQHWRTLSEQMSTFVRHVSSALSKLRCTCQWGHFEATVFFVEMFWKFVAQCSKKNKQNISTKNTVASNCPHGHVQRSFNNPAETCLTKVDIFLLNARHCWKKNSSDFPQQTDEKLSPNIQKRINVYLLRKIRGINRTHILNLHRNNGRKRISLENLCFLYDLRPLRKFFQLLSKKCFNKSVRTEFTAYLGAFEGKNIAFDWKMYLCNFRTLSGIFRFSVEYFHQGCQKCIRPFLGISLRETFAEKNLSFVIVRKLLKKSTFEKQIFFTQFSSMDT